jgi:hypothetical protein
MSCPLCKAVNQSEYPAEMIIHFPGLRNVDKPGVLLFPKLLVCLDCGFFQSVVPEHELALLEESTLTPSLAVDVMDATT